MRTGNKNSSGVTSDQIELRKAFLGGFAGQFISGCIWLVAALMSVIAGDYYDMAVLFFGSMAIFPLTQALLKIMGRHTRLKASNGLWSLGTQIAFTVPINFLLVGAITIFRLLWFFPASMIVVGDHYLPFIMLYGLKMFGVLSLTLVGLGTYLALYGPIMFSLGGWLTGIILIIFAFIRKKIVLDEEAQTTEG